VSDQTYHYTESGLDNVYLANGYEFAEAPGGRTLRIADIDGLHEAIGRTLITDKKNLSGRELRFLRLEMLMSQAVLARLLAVSEQTILRWEKGKTEIPKPAESLVRFLYREHIKKKGGVRRSLDRLAALDDALAENRISLRQTNRGWQAAGIRRAA
jgi:DNA-binding transcriptional regulator YiaG